MGADVRQAATINLADQFGAYQQFHSVNPATGVAWTFAELAALQVGVESVAV